MKEPTSLQTPPAPVRRGRGTQLTTRLAKEGWRGLPGWAFEWMYWNGKLSQMPRMEQTFDRYLLSKRTHKYGITAPIVIYQMGKVGSTALQHSLTALGVDVPVYQMHTLNYLDEAEAWARTLPDPAPELVMLRRGRYVRHAIDSKLWKNVTMISMVRAPGPQLLSAFFQRIDLHLAALQKQKDGQVTPQDVADYFVKYFKPSFPAEWFDAQLHEPFGIDVYASEFPKAQGYQYYEHDTIRLVVIRLEDLSRCVNQVMREFLGIPDFRLVAANVGAEKQYADLYQRVQKILRLPPERIQEVNSQKYAQHFYTPQELETSVARWT